MTIALTIRLTNNFQTYFVHTQHCQNAAPEFRRRYRRRRAGRPERNGSLRAPRLVPGYSRQERGHSGRAREALGRFGVDAQVKRGLDEFQL